MIWKDLSTWLNSPGGGSLGERLGGHVSGSSPGEVTSIPVMVFGEPDELFVMKRSAPAATPVARCHASARRPNVWPGTAAEIRTSASKASTVDPQRGERLVGASNPDRIGTNEDSDPSAMTGDGDLLAGEHTVKDFWQRGSSLAEGH